LNTTKDAPKGEEVQTADEKGLNFKIKQLCELKSGQNVFFIVMEWLVIFTTAFICQKFFNPFLYVFAVVLIGSRFQALGVLMHDAVHYRLFKSRVLNEVIGELLAWPLTLTMQGYRNTHLAHHQNLNTIEDPDFNEWDKYYQFPKTKLQMFSTLVQMATGIGLIYDMIQSTFVHREQMEMETNVPLKLTVFQFSFYAVIATLSIVFSFWHLLLLYWLVPLVTATKFFDYLRGVAEHYAVKSTHKLNSTRNIFGWDCHIVGPYNICVHLAHHLYPGVPWYNLHKLHAVLMEDPEYRDNSLNVHGYAQVIRDCTNPAIPPIKRQSVAYK
jgi:fatty acid desaturase